MKSIIRIILLKLGLKMKNILHLINLLTIGKKIKY